jgi:hypothetical protein
MFYFSLGLFNMNSRNQNKEYNFRKAKILINYDENSEDSQYSVYSNKERIDYFDVKYFEKLKNCRVLVEQLSLNMIIKGWYILLSLNFFS